jgi:3-isopropylmalate dehydrogenase
MYKIAVAPGDGIGKEVIAEGVKVLKTLAEVEKFDIELNYMDLGSDRYLRTGELLTEEDIDFIRQHQAVYFGAIGDPRVAPGVLEKGILIKMRTTSINTSTSGRQRPGIPTPPSKRRRTSTSPS